MVSAAALAAHKEAERQQKAGTLKLGVQGQDSAVTQAAKSAGSGQASAQESQGYVSSSDSPPTGRKTPEQEAEIQRGWEQQSQQQLQEPQQEDDRGLLQQIKELFIVPKEDRLHPVSNPADRTEFAARLAGGAASTALAFSGIGAISSFSLRGITAGAGLKVAGKQSYSLLQKSAMRKVAQASAGKSLKKLARGKVKGILAGEIAINSVNAARTTSLITKIATGVSKNPIATALGIGSLIGTYPFSGFLKEEALQTLSFGVSTAVKNGDVVGAEAALQEQEEVLNPAVWEQIIASIPYANLMKAVKDYYDAARIKMQIDRRTVEKMKEGLAGKTTEEVMQEAEPKWSQRADGGYTPNLSNPLWVPKENGGVEWTGT